MRVRPCPAKTCAKARAYYLGTKTNGRRSDAREALEPATSGLWAQRQPIESTLGCASVHRHLTVLRSTKSSGSRV
jgi:hypothetical protein